MPTDDFIDWWRSEVSKGNFSNSSPITNERSEATVRKLGAVPIHPTEKNWHVNKNIAYQEDWDLTHDMIHDFYGGDPAPPGWKFSPESNGVPSGWVPEPLSEKVEQKALAVIEHGAPRKSINPNYWKIGLLGLGAVGISHFLLSGNEKKYNTDELLSRGPAQQLKIPDVIIEKDNTRDTRMAQLQQEATMRLFENARSGGKRSRSRYAASGG